MRIDYNKNYYLSLELNSNDNRKSIKKNYYKLSKKFHPDLNKDEESLDKFRLITEAYDILMDDELRKEYDTKSRWGACYDELTELLNFEFNNLNKVW